MIEKTEQRQDPEIHPMTLEYLDEVLEIERDSFSSPWPRERFRRDIIDPGRTLSIVAGMEDHVIGYSVAWFIAEEVYIANIAVHRAHRRKGIGKKLLKILLDTGLKHGCHLATLEVRQSNLEAIEMYTKFGFSAIAWRKGYYTDTGEDAVVMLKHLKQKYEAGSRQDLVYTAE